MSRLLVAIAQRNHVSPETMLRNLVQFVLGLVCMAGCSSSAYEDAYRLRVIEYRDAAGFSILRHDAIDMADSSLTLRIPKAWTRSPRKAAVPEWLKNDANLRPLAEGSIPVGDETYPGRLLAAVFDQAPAEIERELEAAARQGQGTNEQALRWTTPSAPSIAEGPAVWRVTSFTREETIAVARSAGTRPVKLATHCECWVSADKDQKACVLLVWLVPNAAVNGFDLPFAEVARLVARTAEDAQGSGEVSLHAIDAVEGGESNH